VDHRRCSKRREGGRPLGFQRSEIEKTLTLITMLERGVPPNIGFICIEVLVHIYRSAPA
jgi:hypothetical protein